MPWKLNAYNRERETEEEERENETLWMRTKRIKNYEEKKMKTFGHLKNNMIQM